MARLLLIRHAPTPETGVRLTGRLPGVSLGSDGEAIAQRTARNLAGLRIRKVYSSPIERTWQTAAIVAEPHGLEPTRHDGLLEVDYGAWSGRTLASLVRLKAWKTVRHTPSRVAFPGGETLADAQRRAVRVCEDIAAEARQTTVALVTHADVIRLAVSHFLGQPLDLYQRLGVAPGSVTVIDIDPIGPPRVVALNTDGGPDTWS